MKKDLKKSLFILLALLSVIFIAACGNKASKKEVIEKFVENSKNIKSMNVAMTMKMEQKKSTNPAGISMEASGNISMIIEPTLAVKMDLTIPFANNKLSMYMKDDYSYVQNPNDNQWIKQSNKEFEEQFKKMYAQSNLIYDFLIKNLDKIDLKEKDGNYLLIIKNFKDLFKDDLKSLNIPESQFDMFNDISMTFEIDKKTFLPITFTMSGAIKVENIKMDFTFEAKYSNINNVKEIIVPKEALEAKETLEVLEEKVKESEKIEKDTRVDKK
ncbi:DUF6612 family protein [Fusobacterium polymorphum]|uniref:DUF6612 family protein n=1 Tax=Fusobacterium nucleatum subsp. polymorphum TaxID=76857 RepID=UPI003009317E